MFTAKTTTVTGFCWNRACPAKKRNGLLRCLKRVAISIFTGHNHNTGAGPASCGRGPIHVSVVDSPPRIELSAGCKAIEDFMALQKVAHGLAALLGGQESEPEK